MAQPRAIAGPQLAQEMLPLVGELAAAHARRRAAAAVMDLGDIEGEASRPRLVEDAREIAVDGAERPPTEPLQLRMVPVPARLFAEHLARKEPFPPERDQPPGVEQRRMKRPEPHAGWTLDGAGRFVRHPTERRVGARRRNREAPFEPRSVLAPGLSQPCWLPSGVVG